MTFSGASAGSRFETVEALQSLVSAGVPESASIEYKRELHIVTRAERLEVLKDLSGMGNGGGGSVIYGIEEDSGSDWPVPVAITPLTERGAIGRLEDITRVGIQPPLLCQLTTVDVSGGHVLVVDVLPSPLGPYMVEAYGDRRHHVRSGTRTMPMTEQQVRDAYAIALRARDRRPDVWATHGLPLTPPTDDMWLIVSALPEEPLGDVVDMRTATVGDFQPPPEMATYINNWFLGDLTPALSSLQRWVDGFHALDLGTAPDEPGHEVRVFRDGAAAVAARIRGFEEGLSPVNIARVLNTAMLYLGWLWESVGLVRPVEITARLHGVEGRQFADIPSPPAHSTVVRAITGPAGLALDPIATTTYIVPWQLRRASVRHRAVLQFGDRLEQALGGSQAEAPFRRGLLHDQAGVCLHVSVGGDTVYDDRGNWHMGWVHTDGSVSATRTGKIVAWYEDGVLLDLAGDAIAVLELAPGVACPDEFVGTTLESDPSGSSRIYTTTMQPPAHGLMRPDPTRQWSSLDARSVFEQQ